MDMEKKSNESSIIGLELHLLRKTPDSNIMMVYSSIVLSDYSQRLPPASLGTFTKARLSQWKYVGDIVNLGGLTSRHWVASLHQFADNTFISMASGVWYELPTVCEKVTVGL